MNLVLILDVNKTSQDLTFSPSQPHHIHQAGNTILLILVSTVPLCFQLQTRGGGGGGELILFFQILYSQEPISNTLCYNTILKEMMEHLSSSSTPSLHTQHRRKTLEIPSLPDGMLYSLSSTA